jgi:RimJ/RimL family protein N-acetyltransferase
MDHEIYFLETERLSFRCWSREDLFLATSLWGDPAVTRWIGGPFSADQVKARLDQEMALFAAHHVQYWPVFLRADGDLVGCAGLRPWHDEEGVFEVGAHLRPMYWKRGLAEEATRAVLDLAFNRLAAKALMAGHHPDNVASGKVLSKLGFQFTEDNFYPPTGQMHPTYRLMGLANASPRHSSVQR